MKQLKKISKFEMIEWLQKNCGIATTPLTAKIWNNSTYPKVKAVYDRLHKKRVGEVAPV